MVSIIPEECAIETQRGEFLLWGANKASPECAFDQGIVLPNHWK